MRCRYNVLMLRKLLPVAGWILFVAAQVAIVCIFRTTSREIEETIAPRDERH